MTKVVNMWVIPEFKRKMKIEAANKGITLVGLQTSLLKADEPLINILNKKGKRKNDFII